MIDNCDSVDIFIGVDVAKGEHHAVDLARAGKVPLDKAKQARRVIDTRRPRHNHHPAPTLARQPLLHPAL